MEQTIKEWLDGEPDLVENIGTEECPIWIIPYDTIQEQLDFLTNGNYNTTNFRHFYTIINDNQAISSSVDIRVKYDNGSTLINRTLSGASTHPLKFINNIGNIDGQTHVPNEAYAATSKSLSIVNACKPLGRKFGKYLNNPTK